MIAALFVETNGCYFGLPGVDPWDKERDARKYDGLYPVVAHPPCERWGRYWSGRKPIPRLSTKQNLATPIPFRDALLSMVRQSRGQERAA